MSYPRLNFHKPLGIRDSTLWSFRVTTVVMSRAKKARLVSSRRFEAREVVGKAVIFARKGLVLKRVQEHRLLTLMMSLFHDP